MKKDVIFITGLPGAGKTTLVKKIYQSLQQTKPDLKVQGFYTEEVRESGSRIGFDFVTFAGCRRTLARINSSQLNGPKVGKYCVDLKSVEEITSQNLLNVQSDEHSILIIDEIGKMELLSEKFSSQIWHILRSREGPKIIICTVARHLVNKVKSNSYPQADIYEVSRRNADTIFQDIQEKILQKY